MLGDEQVGGGNKQDLYPPCWRRLVDLNDDVV